MDKKNLRIKMINKRNLTDKTLKNKFDREIFSNLFTLKEYIEAKNICVYIGFGSEIETLELIKKALKDKKNVFSPRMGKKGEMKFLKVTKIEELEKNKMGILEPLSKSEEARSIDLNILPGLAFDLKGGRIGYGGGYYDRYFKSRPKTKNVALCYEFQIIDTIPMEKHDIKYDVLITESKIIKNRS